ncbi:hypothetical protein V5H98_09740 [Georgenia sp. M64]|uniref:hypothetical protein n=1 Tax=Georgenia sp. M64 TaxID=3120520 RepID=UPI0030E497F1
MRGCVRQPGPGCLVTDTLTRAGLALAEPAQVNESEAFAVLTAELRRAEANHHDLDTLLPRLVAQRTLLDAHDIAAVLTARLARATSRPAPGTTPDLIAGLLPAAAGGLPADAARGLAERRQIIETRAHTLAETAVREQAPWLSRIGERPLGAGDRARWLSQLAVIAAYRDRYGITGPHHSARLPPDSPRNATATEPPTHCTVPVIAQTRKTDAARGRTHGRSI